VITVICLILVVILVLLNAFFVLAEFAVVKARPTQMEALADKGDRRAKTVQYIQNHLYEFLSVCQVGITLASIGLGFVGEPGLAAVLKPFVRTIGAGALTDVAAHGVAITLAYLLVSLLHIVIGELVPKSVGIRMTQESALFVAYPMVLFRTLFGAPIWVLNSIVNAILRLFRLPPIAGDTTHTEEEIRIILGRSQSSGVISFRRLLYIENILDMGALTVRNAMRPRARVRSLQVGAPRPETDRIIAECGYSRYPLIGDDPDTPLGYVHIKDLYLAEHAGKAVDDLSAFVRPCLIAREQEPLERFLPEMQRRGSRLAVVRDANGRWTGIITLEDAVEEVIGTVQEEFPSERPVLLADVLSPDRVVLDVEGESIIAAVRSALRRLKAEDLPVSADELARRVAERESLASSYVGQRLAIPHARLDSLTKPLVIVARLKRPILAPTSGEIIRILFILLTPADTPRVHQILLSHVAGIFGSEFLEDRLYDASTPAELYNAICTAEQAALG